MKFYPYQANHIHPLNTITFAVLDGTINMTSPFMKFPYSVGEQANIKRLFAAMFIFPNAIGTIDCICIGIWAPSVDQFVCMNCKNGGLDPHGEQTIRRCA